MKESEAKSTLINVALSESRERENIYAILQLTFACKNLNLNEQFDQLYSSAWYIHKSGYVSRGVEEALCTLEEGKKKKDLYFVTSVYPKVNIKDYLQFMDYFLHLFFIL